MTVFVRRLIWDRWNVQHIFRHSVLPEEVEEICHANPLVLHGYKGRLALIGETGTGRMLKVILQPKGQNKYYPVTDHHPNRDQL